MENSTQPTLVQEAPWPYDLVRLVQSCRFKAHEGWTVRLEKDFPRDRDAHTHKTIGHGATLIVTTLGYDTYHPERGQTYGVHHYFIVPAATYSYEAWDRWLFEQCAKVLFHEAMEEYKHVHEDGSESRPFAPLHADGMDPYTVHQYATDELKRTRPGGQVVSE